MTTDLTSPTIAGPTGSPPRPARRRRRLALLIAAAAVGVAGIVGVHAITNHDEAPAVPTADPWCAQHRPC